MSITTEIQRLRTNINNVRQDTSDILDAIANKGVTVPTGSNLDDCAGLISQIPSGGGGDIGTLQPIVTTVGNGIDFQNECLMIGDGLVRTPVIEKQTDEIKFEIEFSFDSVNTYNSLLSPIVHWGNIDVHIEFNGSDLWLGIPNSDGSGWQGNWNGSLDYFDLSGIGKTIQSNTWYKLIIIVSCLNKTLSLKLDDVLIFSGSFSQVPKLSDSKYNLFANFDDSINYRSSGKIKYNSLKIYTDGVRVI